MLFYRYVHTVNANPYDRSRMMSLHFLIAVTILYYNITAFAEDFVGKIFLWVPLPTKIKPTKFYTQQKLFTIYYNPCMWRWHYLKPIWANQWSSIYPKGSLSSALSLSAIAKVNHPCSLKEQQANTCHFPCQVFDDCTILFNSHYILILLWLCCGFLKQTSVFPTAASHMSW